MDRRIVIVTGASSGIGRATASHFARTGHRVFGMVRSEESAAGLLEDAIKEGVTIDLLVADVRDHESVSREISRAIDLAGGVDVLVSCAGIASTGVLEDTTPEHFLELFDVNVGGVVRCIQAVLPTMREQRSGCIVNVSSNAGRVAVLAQSAYVASKWGLEGMSEGLAQELAPFGIRVLIVEPGVTKSAIFDKSEAPPPRGGPYDAQYRRMLRYYKRAIPQATEADVVARAIDDAVHAPASTLRMACAFGGAAMIDGRQRLSDEDWVAMGACEDDADYFARFGEAFGLDIT
jgi:NAD(P)-dependent dehydrogenase (short-subunit alcohol dehydrogenase family)